MKKEIVAALITGGLGVVASIIAAFWGLDKGEQTQIEYVESQIANVNGDGNNVTINSVDELIENYNNLAVENKNLKEQNELYFKEKKELGEKVEALEAQLKDSPILQFKNLGLCIDGEDKNINKENSQAIINGVEYYSKDFINNFLSNDTTVTIKEDTMFLGRIIAEKENLFSQTLVDRTSYSIGENVTDSYGNKHLEAARFREGSKAIYSLNGKYAFLKLKIAVTQDTSSNSHGVITINADGKEVYTSEQLGKVDTKEIVCTDININKCSLLEIKCVGDSGIYPIIYDAEVYN